MTTTLWALFSVACYFFGRWSMRSEFPYDLANEWLEWRDDDKKRKGGQSPGS